MLYLLARLNSVHVGLKHDTNCIGLDEAVVPPPAFPRWPEKLVDSPFRKTLCS